MYDNRVRTLIAKLDGELAQLSRVVASGQLTASTVADVRVSFAELVLVLAVEPEPEHRSCPRCGRNVMRLATRCGFCWSALPASPQLS